MTALVVGAVVLGLLACAAAVLALCARAPLGSDQDDLSRLDVLDGVRAQDRPADRSAESERVA